MLRDANKSMRHCFRAIISLLTLLPAALSLAQTGETPDLSTPRRTFRTFYEAVKSAKPSDLAPLDVAASCLDLSGVPESARRDYGHSVSLALRDVLERVRPIDYSALPDAPEGEPFVYYNNEAGSIALDRLPSGEWKFTAATVSAVPRLQMLSLRSISLPTVPGTEQLASLSQWLRSLMPTALKGEGILIETWQWLGLLVILVLGLLIDRLLRAIGAALAERFLRWSGLSVDPNLVMDRTRPVGLLGMALWWMATVAILGLPQDVLSVVAVAIKLVATSAIVWLAYRLVDVLSAVMEQRAERTDTRFDDLLVPLIRKSLKVITVAFGVVFIADNLQVNITSLIAGLGIGGLALAISAQDLLKNMFGSLAVLMDRPFQVGDWVKIGDHEGNVIEVGFRTTRIRTFYNSILTLPNSRLLDSAVDNMGARDFRRWKTTLGVEYGTTPEQIEALCEGVRELIRRHPNTRKDYFQAYANEFGDSAIEILLCVFFEAPDWPAELRDRHRLLLDIFRLAATLGVNIAFPSQTVYLRNDEASHRPMPPVPREVADRSAARGVEAASMVLESSGNAEAPLPDADDA